VFFCFEQKITRLSILSFFTPKLKFYRFQGFKNFNVKASYIEEKKIQLLNYIEHTFNNIFLVKKKAFRIS